jgi:pantetheine-phosphate adenylyltransferase
MEKKKLAIYPGSFNPFTIGHLNILEKAESLFGKENVVILVGNNPTKEVGEIDRVITIKGNLPSKNVDSFTGFLTDYIYDKEQLGFDVVVIKGLRNGDDLDYEVNQMRYLEDRKKDMKTVFLICDKEFEHVSSSGYRACEKIMPGAGHKYLAKEIKIKKD